VRLSYVRIGGLAAGMALSLTLAACGGGGGNGESKSDGSPSTIKIGFMGDLTGENSALVIPPANGAQLAIEEYNKTNPPVKVQFVKYDSQAQEAQAASLAQKAVRDDKIVAMVGPTFSGESQAAVPILEQAKVPNISSSATRTSLASNGWKFWHRVVTNDDFQGPQLADFLIKAKAPKKAFILSDQAPYGVGLADAVDKELKGKGVQTQRDKVDEKAPDFSSTVTKVKAFNPDVVFMGGYYPVTGKMLKQLRDAGVTALFSSGDGSVDPQLISTAGTPAADNVVLACPCKIPFNTEIPELKKFSADYKARFNADPLIYGTEGFDAATAILDVIKSGATDPVKINEGLAKLDFKGVSKEIKFAPNGEISSNVIYIYSLTKGQFSLLGDTTTAKLG